MQFTYIKSLCVGLLLFPIIHSFAQSDELNAVFADLIYDPTQSYTSGSAVVVSLEDGEIYTASQDVPAAADGSNNPKTGANKDTYWGDSASTTQQFEDNNPTFLNDLPSDIDTAELSTAVAQLTNPSTSRIVSVNVRGTIGSRANGDLRIMGFKLSNTSDVLMRGVGPQLEDFTGGLLNADILLPDPSIILYKYKDPQDTRAGSDRITSGDNNDYSTNSNVSEIDAVRAVLNPVVPFHPKQAVSMPSLDSGFYTLQVEDTSGASGIGWAGVDLPSSSTATFTHVSARGLIQTTEYMFGGFQITGTGTRKIFLRGRGSSLTQYNVPNVTSDPLLVLFKYEDGPGTPSTEIDSNDDYTSETNSAEIKTLSTSLYGWPEIEAKESALLLDLEPGYYTIQLRSRSSETDGNGWIGIDDVTDQ
jgi:hypothetical protein